MTPLVMVHGFLGGSDQWCLQEPLGQDRPLIRVDLPGFGKNAHMTPINRIERFAEWVLADVAQQGVDRFDLLGHSMGGMIVQEMIRIAPDLIDRLILYGTGAIGELPGRFEPISTSMERAKRDGPEATARRISATWFRDLEADPEYPACAEIAEKVALPSIIAGLEAMQSWSGEAALAHIKSPSLVIWGDLDRTYPWSQIAQLWQSIPQCNLAVVPNCAHAVHSENSTVFNAMVSDFLR